MIDSPPKIVPLAIDLHENLVEVSLAFRECTKLLDPFASNLRSKHWAEPVPPESDGFVADIDPAFVQQIFDIPQRKRKSDIKHHGQADDLGTGFEVLEGGRFGHGQKLRNRPALLKPSSSDKTVQTGKSNLPVAFHNLNSGH